VLRVFSLFCYRESGCLYIKRNNLTTCARVYSQRGARVGQPCSCNEPLRRHHSADTVWGPPGDVLVAQSLSGSTEYFKRPLSIMNLVHFKRVNAFPIFEWHMQHLLDMQIFGPNLQF